MEHPYSLRKARNILKGVYGWYKKKGHQLTAPQLAAVEHDMGALDQALLQKNRPQASLIAHRLEQFSNEHCKKSIFDYSKELVFAILFALVIAGLLRTVWFEPYEIPTGSMRPTFKERDHLTVTKTAFGINMPTQTDHFYFDPSLVQRTSIVIFSGDTLPLRDTDTTYFGLFPYKKRYIKRAIGKPGDTFYFYGGQLYGIDSEGKEIPDLRDSTWMKPLEYIPFLAFEGDMSAGGNNRILFNHFHKPYGRLTVNSNGQAFGDIFTGKEWIKDKPISQRDAHHAIETYSDFLGIRNYAEARLLTKEEAKPFLAEGQQADAALYLQLRHTPSLTYPKPSVTRDRNGISINIPAQTTLIPLEQRHLEALMSHMYTARFVINDGKARRYSLGDERIQANRSPLFSNVPDGTYEFYHGKASHIKWAGFATDVPSDSPLYSHDPKNVQKLYNLGIEMDTAVQPSPQNPYLFPHRYVYFRDGNLYTMGGLIMEKDDPVLEAFHKQEEKRQKDSSQTAPYVAFKDYGAPVKNGEIDVDFLKTFGITVPEKHYLVLGDNHAMSADSRIFGFVPEANLQGAPYWIVWPPGERLGPPPQKPYPFLNIPRAIVWGIALFVAALWYAYHLWRIRQPIFVKRSGPSATEK